MTRDPLFAALRGMWQDRDPVPPGLVARMQAVAAGEAAGADADLDYELMVLTERHTGLVGVRGGTAYTLRFTYAEVDLLVRVAPGNGAPTRVDGWLVPPAEVTVRAEAVGPVGPAGPAGPHGPLVTVATVDPHGRFELLDLEPGMYRLWLVPHDDSRKPFATPAFEL